MLDRMSLPVAAQSADKAEAFISPKVPLMLVVMLRWAHTDQWWLECLGKRTNQERNWREDTMMTTRTFCHFLSLHKKIASNFLPLSKWPHLLIFAGPFPPFALVIEACAAACAAEFCASALQMNLSLDRRWASGVPLKWKVSATYRQER